MQPVARYFLDQAHQRLQQCFMRALFGREEQNARQQGAERFLQGQRVGAIVVRLLQQVQTRHRK